MDLSALLAREGIGAGDVDALMKWARQRSSALIARIEPGSAIAEALGDLVDRTRDPNAPPTGASPPGRSAPRAAARGVSRPYLGAAVAAALSGKHEDLDLALESAAAESAAAAQDQRHQPFETDLEIPLLEEDTPAPTPEPDLEPVPDENDPSIGGFNRFAFSFRRRAQEQDQQQRQQQQREEEAARQPTLSRGFELQAEPSPDWNEEQQEVPAPPGFEARVEETPQLPAIGFADGESSGGLVLGIPDDDVDIPVQRQRPRSAGIISRDDDDIAVQRPRSAGIISDDDDIPVQRQRPRSAGSISRDDDDDIPVQRPRSAGSISDDDDLPVQGQRPRSAGIISPDSSSSALTDAAFDALVEPSGLGFTDDDEPLFGARDTSGPRVAAAQREPSAPMPVAHAPSAPISDPNPRTGSGPRRVGSGPQVITLSQRVASGPQVARSHAGPPPPPPPRPVSSANGAQRPPPPPADKKGRIKSGETTQPYPPVAGAAALDSESGKRGKNRKKVVDLSQPVARPISAPAPAALPISPAPAPVSEEILAPPPRAPSIPDYLRDDDE